MKETEEIPTVSLQTLAMTIQLVDKEMAELQKVYDEGTATADDDIWMYDLDRAAMNLEEVYKYEIETGGVINFPKYETLIRAGKDKK